jgi:hypothetical protein
MEKKNPTIVWFTSCSGLTTGLPSFVPPGSGGGSEEGECPASIDIVDGIISAVDSIVQSGIRLVMVLEDFAGQFGDEGEGGGDCSLAWRLEETSENVVVYTVESRLAHGGVLMSKNGTVEGTKSLLRELASDCKHGGCECWRKPDLVACPIVHAQLEYQCDGYKGDEDFTFVCSEEQENRERKVFVMWNLLLWMYKCFILALLRWGAWANFADFIDLGVTMTVFGITSKVVLFGVALEILLLLLTFLVRCWCPGWLLIFVIWLHHPILLFLLHLPGTKVRPCVPCQTDRKKEPSFVN